MKHSNHDRHFRLMKNNIAGKSQAIVIGHHRLLTTLDSKSVNNIYKTVRNLGIYIDNDLNWNTQLILLTHLFVIYIFMFLFQYY
ncbi:hypothetical protein C0J52_18487 [Blattella germanica]|nr:hypothetical protein C0J52_18487 [Blattella germanica]